MTNIIQTYNTYNTTLTKFIKITKEQQQEHDQLTRCKDCYCSFTEENKKIMHHNHITGYYVNSICNMCSFEHQH